MNPFVLDDQERRESPVYRTSTRSFQSSILYISHSVSEIARLVIRLGTDSGRVIKTGSATDAFADPNIVRQLGLHRRVPC